MQQLIRSSQHSLLSQLTCPPPPLPTQRQALPNFFCFVSNSVNPHFFWQLLNISGAEKKGTAASWARAARSRTSEMEQQALLPGGDRAGRGRQELWYVHPGGDGQRCGCDEQAHQARTPCCCRWWSWEAAKGRQKQRLRFWVTFHQSLSLSSPIYKWVGPLLSKIFPFCLTFNLSIGVTFSWIPFVFYTAPSLLGFLDKVVWILCCLLKFFWNPIFFAPPFQMWKSRCNLLHHLSIWKLNGCIL